MQGSGGLQALAGISSSHASPHLALGFVGLPASFLLSRHVSTLSSWEGAEMVHKWGSHASCPTPIAPRLSRTPTWRPCLTLALLTWTTRGSFGVSGGAAGSWLCFQLPGLIGSGAGAGLACRGKRPACWGRALEGHVPARQAQLAWASGPAPFPCSQY